MPERETIDLNADVGEGAADDAVVPLVSSVNVACGAHAGDAATMRAAIDAALRHGCAIGAHPGYPDREHMGRRPMTLAPREVTVVVADQVRTLAEVAQEAGATLRHVKPHGALYNQGAGDAVLARAIASAVVALDAALTLVGPAGSELIDAARAAGLDAAEEAFCDRRYRSDGTLVPRSQATALIQDPAAAAAQAVALALGRPVDAEGGPVTVHARTLCLHADTPGAGAIAAEVRRALEAAGVGIARL